MHVYITYRTLYINYVIKSLCMYMSTIGGNSTTGVPAVVSKQLLIEPRNQTHSSTPPPTPATFVYGVPALHSLTQSSSSTNGLAPRFGCLVPLDYTCSSSPLPPPSYPSPPPSPSLYPSPPPSPSVSPSSYALTIFCVSALKIWQ